MCELQLNDNACISTSCVKLKTEGREADKRGRSHGEGARPPPRCGRRRMEAGIYAARSALAAPFHATCSPCALHSNHASVARGAAAGGRGAAAAAQPSCPPLLPCCCVSGSAGEAACSGGSAQAGWGTLWHGEGARPFGAPCSRSLAHAPLPASPPPSASSTDRSSHIGAKLWEVRRRRRWPPVAGRRHAAALRSPVLPPTQPATSPPSALPAAAVAAAAGAPLQATAAYEFGQPPQAMIAPNVALQGVALADLEAPTVEKCTQLCYEERECAWVNWCPAGDRVRAPCELPSDGGGAAPEAQRRCCRCRALPAERCPPNAVCQLLPRLPLR